jgi:hypothetical protein
MLRQPVAIGSFQPQDFAELAIVVVVVLVFTI